MIYLDHLIVKTYGGLEIRPEPSDVCTFSGSGGGQGSGPPKPHAPIQKPKKPKKKK